MPRRIPGSLFLQNLVYRRSLLLQLVRRDFEQRFVGSAMGWVWGLIHPLVLLVSWLSIAWIAPLTPRDALLIGALWLVLTLAFEFLVGHYVFHKPWAELTEDYHVLRGRIWPLVLLLVLFGPLWTGRLRGLW